MSLEGLSSLIQLESTRLESVRQSNQTFQQNNSEVQRIGLQTAQTKISVWKDRINTTCEKEIQEAEVRKLESKLARERKAEALASMISQGVVMMSVAGNLWNLAEDAFGKQKLGDIPKYLQTPKLDPKSDNLEILNTPQKEGGGQRAYVVGKNENGMETVYCMDRAASNNGQGQSMTNPRAANISAFDMDSILGQDPNYQALKARLGGNVSFSDLVKNNPALADKVMDAAGHGMGRKEADNFADILSKKLPDGGRSLQHTEQTPSNTNPTITDADKAAKIKEILELQAKLDGKVPLDENTLAKIRELLPKEQLPQDLTKLTDAQREDISKKLSSISGAINTPTTPTGTTAPEATEAPKFDRKNFQIKGTSSMIVQPQLDGSNRIVVNNQGKTLTFSFTENDPKFNEMKKLLDTGKDVDRQKVIDMLNEGIKNDKQPLDVKEGAEATSAFDVAKSNIDVKDRVIESLKGQNLLPKNYGSSVIGKGVGLLSNVGKSVTDLLVNTAKDAAPYFQAYLSMKTRADQTEEELIAARAKLAAITKKLKAIQMQLELFGGREA